MTSTDSEGHSALQLALLYRTASEAGMMSHLQHAVVRRTRMVVCSLVPTSVELTRADSVVELCAAFALPRLLESCASSFAFCLRAVPLLNFHLLCCAICRMRLKPSSRLQAPSGPTFATKPIVHGSCPSTALSSRQALFNKIAFDALIDCCLDLPRLV